MNHEICKKCGLMKCYVIDDRLIGDKDDNEFIVLLFCCIKNPYYTLYSLYYEYKGLECYNIVNKKWKRFEKKKNWHKFNKNEYIEQEFNRKNIVIDQLCPYYVEHILSDFNQENN